MDGYFVITWRNLHIEINAKELVSSLLKEYTSLTETELINRAKKLLSLNEGHWPQECSVTVVEEPFLLEGEVIVYQEKCISYHKLLTAIVTVLDLLHEDLKKKIFIANVANHLNKFDTKTAGKFEKDFSAEIYRYFIHEIREAHDSNSTYK